MKPECQVCHKHHFGICRFKGQPKCVKCNRFGHIARDCNSNMHKPQANYAKKEEENTATLFYACHAASVEDNSIWFVDSPCSNHMTSQESELINLDKTVKCKVKMGSGELVDATGKGVLAVNTKAGKRYINEVLLVPGLDENLLSVGQMIEHGYYVLFGVNLCSNFL